MPVVDILRLLTSTSVLKEQLNVVTQAAETAIQTATQYKVEMQSVSAEKDLEIESLKQMRGEMETHVDDLEKLVDDVTAKCMDMGSLVNFAESARLQAVKDTQNLGSHFFNWGLRLSRTLTLIRITGF